MSATICTVPACGRPAVGGGLCGTHYQRRRRGRAVEGPLQPRGGLEVLTLRLPVEIASALRRAARGSGMTIADMIRLVLVLWHRGRGGAITPELADRMGRIADEE